MLQATRVVLLGVALVTLMEPRSCAQQANRPQRRSSTASGPISKPIATFETENPFTGGSVVAEHASQGSKSLLIVSSFVSLERPQDWRDYDLLKADVYTNAKNPLDLVIEVRDAGTRDYWTRVNYSTVVTPGQSTLIVPVKQLYVGEKSRPGRMLDLGKITRLVFNIGDRPAAPLFLDNVRLERDVSLGRTRFAGLHAFDLGTSSSPVMEGFHQITPETLYSRDRGYGLLNARIWRAFDALQPDPLYQDFICIEAGGLAVDLPIGHYRVFVNIDSPSGYWGEYQRYHRRAVLAEGQPVVTETMDFEHFRTKYFRFWNSEDVPGDVTFEKYQKALFQEKRFDVKVRDGQLNLEFQGEDWACCVSAVIIFPVAEAEAGERFLDSVAARRRFHFDNYFKRVVPPPTGDPLRPTEEDRRRGFVAFVRDPMLDVSIEDTPLKGEVLDRLRGEAFAGEYEPITLALVPLRPLGTLSASASDLSGPRGTIPSSAIDVGFVSNRISRVTMEGTVYKISPRLVMPHADVPMQEKLTRRLWLTVQAPKRAVPGTYKGTITLQDGRGDSTQFPLEFRVRSGTLDPVDIPAGPFGHAISIPWYGEDPQAARFNREMISKSLRKLRDYGFTACTGMPSIRYRGFENGRPVLDFTLADEQMKLVKDLGFLAVTSYGAGLADLNAYEQDRTAMSAAGFRDYARFIRAIYSAIQQHASRNGWIPVYYNLCDEPIGEALVKSAENAEAYQRAFPKGPPYFTGASSFTGKDRSNPAFRLSRALSVVSWNDHDEDGVNLLRSAGGDWAFYNGASRWTYGTYMYKAAHQFAMKFRIAWHWNIVAGDPYYGLDCREDDYAWCNASPDGMLIPSVFFERLREGLDDYRRLLTLARLARQAPDSAAAKPALELIATRMNAFRLGQRDHDELFPPGDWALFRHQVDDLIEDLRKDSRPGFRK
jgi:hypothetical protein